MPAVAVPSRNRLMVSLTPRPQRACRAMNSMVPSGRATNASANSANDHSVPCRRSMNGKNTAGNTSAEAMPKTKKSKYSDARPITTPTAISPGATSASALVPWSWVERVGLIVDIAQGPPGRTGKGRP